ncbi:hypothetical protein [Cellulomonas oligotrophica]|uniref:CBM-cenC domain-containing protein n=1 Tax=Cellulomonas oligotrophica TaxID=931536 RepID=A0A7Y9FI76_9CELL|nr:hypothetical protein [Cellulomonas oligotrophica]NYD87774.1 hypothetical protein [Cellulomonas oligotrophica]GIG33022.1 hypothetical protein Col01nite_21810 [Cellulomonas oligotrophica]
MPAALTATALPDLAAVRLSLSASAELQVLADDDWSTASLEQAEAAALAWASSGNAKMVGADDGLRLRDRSDEMVVADDYEASTGAASWGRVSSSVAGAQPTVVIAPGSSGTRCVAFWGAAAGSAGAGVWDRTVYGLTPGVTYTVRARVSRLPSRRAGTFTFGVGGIGATDPAPISTVWTLVEYTFTATSISHNVRLTHTYTAGSGEGIVQLDDLTVTTAGAPEYLPRLDGVGYVERSFSDLVVGREYAVGAWLETRGPVDGFTVEFTVDTVVHRVTQDLTRMAKGDSAERTPVWFTFTATASSVTLRIRPMPTPGTVTGAGQWVTLKALDVRWVGGPAALALTFRMSDTANWTPGGTAPTGLVRTMTTVGVGVLAVHPYAWPHLVLTAAIGSGTTVVTVGAGTQWARRTIPGLSPGRRYRVLVACEASTAGAVGASLRTTVGVTGLVESAPSTGRWAVVEFLATSTSHELFVKIADAATVQESTMSTASLRVHYVRVVDTFADLTDTYELRSLTRADVNGRAAVRRLAGQDIEGGSLIVSDYEPALTGLVVYEALVRDTDAGTDELVSASVDLTGMLSVPVLAPATLPQHGRRPLMVTNVYEASRRSLATVHEVVGRPDPLVTLGRLRTREGSFEVLVRDYPSAVELLQVYERGEVVLLRDPTVPGVDMYHVVAGRLRLSPSGRRWVLQVDYVEVARPTGPLLGGLGWTFDEAFEQLASFDVARAAFPSFNDYTVGPS